MAAWIIKLHKDKATNYLKSADYVGTDFTHKTVIFVTYGRHIFHLVIII